MALDLAKSIFGRADSSGILCEAIPALEHTFSRRHGLIHFPVSFCPAEPWSG
jgi:hypothetical protein